MFRAITLGDLLTVPEISSFKSSKYVLHLKDNNVIKIKDKYYECRIFAFDIDSHLSVSEDKTFGDYVKENEFSDIELSRNSDYKVYKTYVLSYTKNTSEEYILISLRSLELETKTINLTP